MFNMKMPNLGPLNRPLRFIRSQLPPLNFITYHYLYFILTSLGTALIFWGSSTPFRSVSFTDSIFLTTSAMTLAGLNTVNLSSLNTFHQFLLFCLVQLGSAIFVSAFVVHVRRKAFDRKFLDVEERRGKLGRVKTWASSTLGGRSHEKGADEEAGDSETLEKKADSSSVADEPGTNRNGKIVRDDHFEVRRQRFIRCQCEYICHSRKKPKTRHHVPWRHMFHTWAASTAYSPPTYPAVFS